MTTAPTIDFMSRLKAETRARHDATEAIPYSSAIVEETLPKAIYVTQLAAYVPMHRTLEQALRDSKHEVIQAVWDESLVKLGAFQADLEFFGATEQDLAPHVRRAVEQFEQAVRCRAEHDPVSLLGYLYVVEGSTLGGTILTQHVQSMYELDRDGVRSLLPYEKHEVMPRWRAFRETVNGLVTDEAMQERIIDGACDAFDRIGEVLRALLIDEAPASVVETPGSSDARCPFGHG